MDAGISTVIYSDFCHCGRNPDLFKALEKLSGMGYRHIEYSDQSVPHPFCLKDDEAGEISRALDSLGLSIQSIHIPCPQLPDGDIGSTDDGVRKIAVETAKRTLDACRQLDVRYAVIHPGGAGQNLADDAAFGRVRDVYHASLRSLCEYARGTGVTLAIENGGSRLSTLKAMADTVACLGMDNCDIAICVDTGHANGMGMNAPTMIEQAGEMLRHLHIHDNNGREDEHLVPGEGTIDWKAVLKALHNVNYDGVFMIEAAFSRNSKDPDVIAARAKQVSDDLIAGHFAQD